MSYELLATLKQASHRTGVDFAYLVAQAGQESGFRTDAQARTSSARGLFQFIESTWFGIIRDHGAKYGLGAQAQQIVTDGNGRPWVRDAEARRDILKLRDDPRIAAAMAAEYARANQQILSRELGMDLKKVDLYLGHFLGPSGASKFLSALKNNPAQDAVALLPEAAAANRGVFYTEDGRPRSVGDIYSSFERKLAANARGLASVPLDTMANAGNRSAVQSHLDEQRRIIDHNVKMMAMEMLHRIMRGDRDRIGRDLDSSF